MIKICYECPTLLLRRPIAELIARLKGYEIGLLAPKDLIKGFIPIHYNKFSKKLKNKRIHAYSIINPPFTSYEWPIPVNPLFIIRSLKILKKYDIIHQWVPFYINGTILAILKKLFFPKKTLFITVDNFPGVGVSFRMGKFLDMIFRIYYNTLGKIVFSAANKVVLYGNSIKKIAMKAGVPKDKITIIPSGIDFKIKDKDKDIRKEFGIDKDKKVILFIGLINKRKGVDIVIKIAQKFTNQNVKFIIAGDGPQRKQYQKLIRLYNLNDKIIFTGFRKDIHNFYHEADLLLLPSRGEGLPGVVMESMVYGVPVVSSDITGTRDLIQNNENGFLCKYEDINDFMKKIEILLNDTSLREKFVENSKKKIKNKFNWEKSIEKIEKIYG